MKTIAQPSITFPFDLVRPYLDRVESLVSDQVEAFDPGVKPYMEKICRTSGKRIRPALAALVGEATGGSTDDHLMLGVTIELIHMATLVHDDIIDGATTRRKEMTPNTQWGNGMAVLLGDALFSHALKLSTDFNDLTMSRAISQASREVCEGEILQTQRRFDLTLTKKEYFRIIEMKTGALFAVAAGLSARLSGEEETVCEAMYEYGMKLGRAYQIYDDVVDLVGDEEESGKTLGTDLAKGKLTLPMLNLLEQATQRQRDQLHKRIIEGGELDPRILAGIAEYEGAIANAVDTGIQDVEDALAALDFLPESNAKAALAQIARFVESLLRASH